MGTLNLAAILDAKDIEYVTINTPEWGAGSNVILASLDSASYNAWLERNGEVKLRQAAVELVVRSLVNEDLTRQVDASDVETLVKMTEALRKKDARIVQRLVSTVLKLNGLTGPGAAEIKNALGEAKKDASPSA